MKTATTKSFTFLLLFIILFHQSCKDDPLPKPSAAFSFTINETTVTFINASTNSETYQWTFGDGGVSVEKNPVYIYPLSSKTYTVTLKVKGGGGEDISTQSLIIALPKFSLSGNVTNSTGRPVKEAVVSIYKTGETTLVTSVVTSSVGGYSFLTVEKGSYDIKVTKAGYLTTSGKLTADANKTQDYLLAGEANVTGVLIDSQTGLGLDQARVSFSLYTGTLPTSVENGELVVTTNSNGRYTITGAPIGNYAGIVEITGYFPRSIGQVNFVAGSVNVPQQTLVSRVPDGQLRVILTWGATPSDLDTHLTGPTGVGSNRFHLYWFNKIPSTPGTMSLDVDDTSSYGPETTTMKSFFVGTYRYSVHNFSDRSTAGSAGIYSSPARVELYDYNGLVRSFSPPTTTAGNTWKVFELVFTTTGYTINELNSYTQASDYTNGTSFRTSNPKDGVKLNDDDF